MNLLQDELVIIQDSLKGSALESDYPDIDRNIDFKTHNDYINEDAEDYILRTNNDFYEYPENEEPFNGIPEEQENLYNYDNKQYKRFPLVHNPETIKKTAEFVKKQEETNDYNIENFNLQNLINNIINIMSELFSLPPNNENYIDYYYNIITKENNSLYIIFILLLIIYATLSLT
jgi:hypothetical protein